MTILNKPYENFRNIQLTTYSSERSSIMKISFLTNDTMISKNYMTIKYKE